MVKEGVYAVATRVIVIFVALGQFGLPEVMLYQMRANYRNKISVSDKPPLKTVLAIWI